MKKFIQFLSATLLLLLGLGTGILAYKTLVQRTCFVRHIPSAKSFIPKTIKQFYAQDIHGKPIIIEWYRADSKSSDWTSSEYAQNMAAVLDIMIKASSNEFPIEGLLDFALYNRWIDWDLVEKQMARIAPTYLQQQSDSGKTTPFSVFIVAKEPISSKILGFAIYHIDGNVKSVAELGSLVVLYEERMRGIGTLLAASILRIVPEITKIIVMQSTHDSRVRSVYESFGFAMWSSGQQGDVQMEYRAKEFGSWELEGAAEKLAPRGLYSFAMRMKAS